MLTAGDSQEYGSGVDNLSAEDAEDAELLWRFTVKYAVGGNRCA